MRLISQDGMIDVPYEISALSIGTMGESATIYVRSKLLDEKPCVFATYSNTDKVLKAMEMLRETYLSRMELDGGYDIVNGCYVQPNYWVLPKVFKFSDDSEVEVQEWIKLTEYTTDVLKNFSLELKNLVKEKQ